MCQVVQQGKKNLVRRLLLTIGCVMLAVPALGWLAGKIIRIPIFSSGTILVCFAGCFAGYYVGMSICNFLVERVESFFVSQKAFSTLLVLGAISIVGAPLMLSGAIANRLDELFSTDGTFLIIQLMFKWLLYGFALGFGVTVLYIAPAVLHTYRQIGKQCDE